MRLAAAFTISAGLVGSVRASIPTSLEWAAHSWTSLQATAAGTIPLLVFSSVKSVKCTKGVYVYTS